MRSQTTDCGGGSVLEQPAGSGSDRSVEIRPRSSALPRQRPFYVHAKPRSPLERPVIPFVTRAKVKTAEGEANLCNPGNRMSALLFDAKGGTAEMRVGGAGTRWQDGKQSEKQRQPEAFGLRADDPRTSRLTPEPPALSVAGPFSFIAKIARNILRARR